MRPSGDRATWVATPPTGTAIPVPGAGSSSKRTTGGISGALTCSQPQTAAIVLLAALAPARGGDFAPEKLARIPARMQAFVDDQEIAGAVTVVGRKDGVVSLDAVGSVNLEKGRPMTKDALFRIASMTKPVTAVG